MNIQGGGISFEISGTNDKLLRILEQSKASMQSFSGEVKRGGKDIDGAFNAIVSSINKARADLDKTDVAWSKTYDKIVEKLNEVRTARGKAFEKGNDAEYNRLTQEAKQIENQKAQWEKVGKEIRASYDELDKEEAAIRRQYEEATKVAEAHDSIRTQLRKAKEVLMEMEQAGKRGTDEYERQREEVVRLTTAMSSANKQAKNLSNPNRNFQAVIGGLSLMTSGYQAVTGAMGLFAGENENLQRVMTKVQSVMSITMALQTAYTQLNKNSAFQLVLVARAKDMLTAANARLATSLGISTAAAQALLATLTLGLTAAITAIIVLISKMQSKAAEAKKQIDDFNRKVGEAAGEPLAAFASLQGEWVKLTDSLQEREKWVQQNADKFASLGLKVYDAKTAEDVLISNADNFVRSCVMKAKALASQQIAAEKYAEIIKKQAEVEAMPDTVNKVITNRSTGGDSYEVQQKNTAKEKAQAELKAMEEQAQKFIEMSLNFSKEENALLASIGNASANVIEGSVEAVEHEISMLQTQYKRAATDKDRADFAAKIKAEQEKLKKIQLDISSGSSEEKKDPYAEMLAERKALYAQYSRWVQSEDETVREAASSEFANLLEEGKSYLDFLTKQREDIMAKQTKTANDLHQLQLLNNEIAEATKQTVLSDFDEQLKNDLAVCRTIGEMLDVIEKRRGNLTGDGSDIDNGKADILNTAERATQQQAKEETASLLQEYAGYINEKLLFEESYARKKELLMKKAEKAATEQERQVATAALEALEQKRTELEQRSASQRYDTLKEQYRTYAQQLNDIQREYDEQRNEATKQGDFAMIAQIDAKQQEAISKLAAQKLMASESWTHLFSDLSTLSNKAINDLMADINSQKVTLSAQFNPADLKAIEDQLEKAKGELHKRNPFLALKDSLKELRASMQADKLMEGDDPFIKSLEDKKRQYQQYTEAVNSSDKTLAGAAKEAFADLLKEGSSYIDMLRRRIAALQDKRITIGLTIDEDNELAKLEAVLNSETGAAKTLKESLKDTFASVSSSIDFIDGAFDSVVGGMKKMGIAMDEETQQILGDISEMMSSASKLADGIATANPLGIIQGTIGLISSFFDLFNSRDRRAERSIKRHEEAVTRLGEAYTQLQHAVNKALGESVYRNQSASIRNLKQQQAEMRAMIEDEKSKKKTDWDRINEWQSKINDAGREIEDIIDSITKSITQTEAKELAGQLGDALVEAFTSGTSAAKAFDKVTGDVLRNAVMNALKLQFLEEPLQEAIKQLQRDMGFTDEGAGTFDGLTKDEQDRFRSAVKQAGAQFQEAFKVYESLFDELNEKDPSTLSGAIKGASQESIDLLAGQANAVRMNQVTSLDILRNQLTRLCNIDSNVGVIANRLLTIINRLSTPADDGLRGQGITD